MSRPRRIVVISDLVPGQAAAKRLTWLLSILWERAGLGWDKIIHPLSDASVPTPSKTPDNTFLCFYGHPQRQLEVTPQIVIPSDDSWITFGVIHNPSRLLESYRHLCNGDPSPDFAGRCQQINFDFDVLALIWYLVTLQEEEGEQSRDAKLRVDIDQRRYHARELVTIPLIDHMASLIRTHLKLQNHLIWPDNHKYCVILSHDIDVWNKNNSSLISGAIALQRALRYRRLDLGFIHYWRNALFARNQVTADNYGFRYAKEIVRFEMELGIRSTWFIFSSPWTAGKWDLLYDVTLDSCMRKLIGLLMAEDFEVGLHASMGSAFNPALLQHEIARLNRIIEPLGSYSNGVRQHELAGIVKERTSAFSRHFTYDTSIGFNKSIGFRPGISTPYTPYGSSSDSFLEMPLSLMDNSLFSFQSEPEHMLGDAVAIGTRLLDEVRKVSGMVVMNWHPHVWDCEKYPNWGPAFYELVKYAVQTGAWVTTAKNAAEYWIKRRNDLQKTVAL